MLSNLILEEDSLSVGISSSGAVDFDYFWLRDNSRDPISFDSRSHQRELFTCEVDADIRPDEAGLTADGLALQIKWPDLDEAVFYTGMFLENFAATINILAMPDPIVWDVATLDHNIVQISHREVIADNGIRKLLDIISRSGFSVITETPRNMDAVLDVTDRIGYVRHTIFGGLWE